MFSTQKRSDFPYAGGETAYVPPATAGSGIAGATVIARGVKVEGEFHSQGDVLIEGDVQGSLSAAGTLTVGSEATIRADIKAQEAIISGEITGNLQITRQAVFHASARVKGDVTAERITVEAGAIIEGRFQIGGGLANASKEKENSPAKDSEKKGDDQPTLIAETH
jgi:cytoskeletal protein CcmA (bactofilin family)